MEHEDQLMESYHQRSNSLRRHSQRLPLSAVDGRNIDVTYPTDAIINPAYTHDEDYVINGMYYFLKKNMPSTQEELSIIYSLFSPNFFNMAISCGFS